MTLLEAIKILETNAIISSKQTEFCKAVKVATFAMSGIQNYLALGTVEECREALEKQKMKRPLYDKPIGVLACPCCGGYLQKVVDNDGPTDGRIPHYCSRCGQRISPYWTMDE